MGIAFFGASKKQYRQHYKDSIRKLKAGTISPADIGLEEFTTEQAIQLLKDELWELEH